MLNIEKILLVFFSSELWAQILPSIISYHLRPSGTIFKWNLKCIYNRFFSFLITCCTSNFFFCLFGGVGGNDLFVWLVTLIILRSIKLSSTSLPLQCTAHKGVTEEDIFFKFWGPGGDWTFASQNLGKKHKSFRFYYLNCFSTRLYYISDQSSFFLFTRSWSKLLSSYQKCF